MNETGALLKKGIIIGCGFLIPLALAGLVTGLLADSLNSFSSGDTISSSKINSNFEKMPPVGAVIAWHKDLTGVSSTLPDGWLECDGSTVSDSESALNGVTLPDLNGEARFIRGSGTSGTLQNATTVLSLREIGNSNELVVPRNQAGTSIWPADWDEEVDDGTLGRAIVAVDTVDSLAANQRADGYRVRSKNMSVVWIIRIK